MWGASRLEQAKIEGLHWVDDNDEIVDRELWCAAMVRLARPKIFFRFILRCWMCAGGCWTRFRPYIGYSVNAIFDGGAFKLILNKILARFKGRRYTNWAMVVFIPFIWMLLSNFFSLFRRHVSWTQLRSMQMQSAQTVRYEND